MAKDSNVEINIGIVVQPETVGEIDSIVRHLYEVGVDSVRIKLDYVSPEGLLGKDTFKKLMDTIQVLKQELESDTFKLVLLSEDSQETVKTDMKIADVKKCYSTLLLGTLGPDGHIYPCDHRSYPGGGAYGDIKQKTFQDIWESKEHGMEAIINLEKCKYCNRVAYGLNRLVGFLDTYIPSHPEYWYYIEKKILEWKGVPVKTTAVLQDMQGTKKTSSQL